MKRGKFFKGQRVVVYDYDRSLETTNIDREPEIHCQDRGAVLKVGEHHLFVDTDFWTGPAWYTKEQCRRLYGKKRKKAKPFLEWALEISLLMMLGLIGLASLVAFVSSIKRLGF